MDSLFRNLALDPLPVDPDHPEKDRSLAQYRATLYDAVLHPDGELAVRQIDEEDAVLIDRGQVRVYLRYLADLEEEILARLEQLGSHGAGRVEVAILGGPPGFRNRLDLVTGQFANGSPVVHWATDGSLWGSKRARRARLLQRLERLSQRHLEPFDSQRFAEAVQRARERFHVEQREVRNFSELFQARKPYATRTLIALNAIMFGLELVWGRTDSLMLLWRMGSMSRAEVQAGEIWRLLSYAWLHGGFSHFFINMWVLVVLGGLMERLLGPARFFILYVAGALGGGIAVYIGTDAQTVGASGAIWAMLTASFVLSFKSDGLLPSSVMHTLRKNAFINLALNLAVSFLPQVSLAGHLGGGIAGAVLVGSGVLSRRLGSQSTRSIADAPVEGPLKTVLVIALVAFLAAPILALLKGRPWAAEHNAYPDLTLSQAAL